MKSHEGPKRAVLISHFHWDREWYRTFQAYRARLVDALDRVLELLEQDSEYRFLLDGQAVLLEDYLEIRPSRREHLERGLRAGRLAAGPWYVQPDSLLPAGESHIRNLLRGRRVAVSLGGCSRVGYVPDSFGHPAQLPQILRGVGIDSFVYWRGNGAEIDSLGPRYRWLGPDGSEVEAVFLRQGYFNAGCLPDDTAVAGALLRERVERLAQPGGAPEPLMNGLDHMLPDSHAAAAVAEANRTPGIEIRRGLLEDVLGSDPALLPPFVGELCGGRVANLLAGVWSTQIPIKQANRRCESLLLSWLEPWVAFACALSVLDETPALAAAWRLVLLNQAHDSLCGCSVDPVIEQVLGRYAEAERLAGETIDRLLARVAGMAVERRTPWSLEQDVAVFNSTPAERTDVVRVPLSAYPSVRMPGGTPELAPLALAAMDPPGFLIDGKPVRVVLSNDPNRVRWIPGQKPFDLEFVAERVPAFGYRRYRVEPGPQALDEADDGTSIGSGDVRAEVAADGSLAVLFGAQRFDGLLGVEDLGDRGDSYDFDPVPKDQGARQVSVRGRRFRHVSGIERLEVRRCFELPAELEENRERRSRDHVLLEIVYEARVVPGVRRVDVRIWGDNLARDHRLRLRFPTGAATASAVTATTFDVAERSTARSDDSGWVHAAPGTFCHQGWVHVNGLTVVAPGLPEAEVTADGVLSLTLLRAVGWLSRFDLRSRSEPAGPAMETPRAQVLGPFTAEIALLPGLDPAAAAACPIGLRGAFAGPAPLVPEGVSLLRLEPASLLLTAVKPAEEGRGLVVRVLNPTLEGIEARLALGLPQSSSVRWRARPVRLDEEPADFEVRQSEGHIRFTVPPKALRTLRVERVG